MKTVEQSVEIMPNVYLSISPKRERDIVALSRPVVQIHNKTQKKLPAMRRD